jgi:hypothetical protein
MVPNSETGGPTLVRPALPPIVKVLAWSRRPRRSSRHPVGTKIGYPSRDIICKHLGAPGPKWTRRCGSGTMGGLTVEGCSAHSKGTNFVPPHPYPAKLGITSPHNLPLHVPSIGPKPARRRPAATLGSWPFCHWSRPHAPVPTTRGTARAQSVYHVGQSHRVLAKSEAAQVGPLRTYTPASGRQVKTGQFPT